MRDSTSKPPDESEKASALSAHELAALSRLLDEALGLDADARAAWLDALPVEHAPLVRSVEANGKGGRPRRAV